MVSVVSTIGWHPTKPHTESTWGGNRIRRPRQTTVHCPALA